MRIFANNIVGLESRSRGPPSLTLDSASEVIERWQNGMA